MKRFLGRVLILMFLVVSAPSYSLLYSKNTQQLVVEYGIYTVELGFHYGMFDDVSFQGGLVLDPIFARFGVKGLAVYHIGSKKGHLDLKILRLNSKFDPHIFGGLWFDTDFGEVSVGIPMGIGLAYRFARKLNVFSRVGFVMGVGNVFSLKGVFYIGAMYKVSFLKN